MTPPTLLALPEVIPLAESGAIDAILFDWDGTLVDTADAHYHALARALSDTVGLHLERHWFDARTGLSTMRVLKEISVEHAVALDADAIACEASRNYRDLSCAVSEITPVANLLRERPPGIRAGLVTGSRGADVHGPAARLELLGLFDAIVTADDVQQTKPDPEGYRVAVRTLGVRGARVVVIEDSDEGLAAARATPVAFLADVRQ